MKKCIDCGIEMPDAHWSRKRCLDCASKQSLLENRERSKATQYKLELVKRGDAKCNRCGRPIPWQPGYDMGEMHHIVPLSKGGTSDPSNLELLCWECHQKEHERL